MSSRVVGLLVAAVTLLGGVGCEMQSLKLTRTPAIATETGVELKIEQTPQEVQDFVKKSYPDAQVSQVHEITHSERMRHFEIELLLPGDRKKMITYNTFPTKSPVVTEISAAEPKGAGTK